MTTYGPTSGVAKEDLFDFLCNRIDSNISGNATGWSIIADSRDSSRVTDPGNIASNYKPIARQSNIPVTAREAAVGKGILVQRALQNPTTNVYFLWAYVLGETITSRYATSSDGVTYGSFAALVGATSTTTYPAISQKMLPYNNSGGMGYFTIHLSTGTAVRANYALTPDTLITGTNVNLTMGGTASGGIYHVWATDFNTGQAYAFWPVDGNTEISYALLGHPTTPVASNYSYQAATGMLLSASGIAVDGVYGVAGIEAFEDEYDIYVNVLHGGANKIILCRTVGAASVPTNPLSAPISVVSYDNVLAGKLVDPTATLGHGSALVPAGSEAISRWYYGETPPGDDRNVSTFSLFGEVDGIPDLNGLQYEYVVFQSSYTANTGDGYFLILLQLNPNQSLPPAIANLSDPTTGTFPIFARLTRFWDVGSDQPTRFFLDPNIPTSFDPDAEDMYGPCLLTVPNPGGPVDTHKVWLKVNQRQIFAFTESSASSKNQYLHINITEPLAPLEQTVNTTTRNDNIFAHSSGSLLGAGAIYLGRNGQSESSAFDSRKNGEVFYPLGATLTYANLLNVENTVDEFSYAFPIYGGSDTASLDLAADVNLSYSSGKLVDTLFYTDTTGLSNGDTVTVGADSYKYFGSSANTGSHFDGIVLEELLIKWV